MSQNILDLKRRLAQLAQRIAYLRQKGAHFAEVDDVLSYKTCLERQIQALSNADKIDSERSP